MLADLMLKFFHGRASHVAVWKNEHFEPFDLQGKTLQSTWLEARHLGGQQCLGFYLLTEESKCFCAACDFDNKPESPDPMWQQKAEQLYYALSRCGLHPLIEISQSGQAAHVWIFFSEATDAWVVRSFLKAIAEREAIPLKEIYPRQDRLTGKGLGNLIRYPLWGESRFVDAEGDFETIDPLEALQGIRTVSGDDLKLLAFQLGLGDLKPTDLVVAQTSNGLPIRVQRLISKDWTLLSKRWLGDTTGLSDPSRSGAAMSIAVELVRNYVPTPEVEAALKFWCLQNGSAKGEREEWISRTVTKAYDFILNRQESASVTTGTFKDATLAFVDSLTKGKQRHIRSGITDLDYSIDGVAEGEVCVIGGRPGHGKSALAAQWLDLAAIDGVPGLFISEEMSSMELASRRLLSIASKPQEAWDASAVPELKAQVTTHYDSRAPIYLIESCHTIDRVEEVIDQFCSIHGVKLVCVDYMQLLGARGASRYDAVSEISRRLKQCARRNSCALLALSQMSRAVEKRENFDPKASDLRDSGQIEQDADLVMFCIWPCRVDKAQDPENYWISIEKRRNGPIRKPRIVTKFNPAKQTIGGMVLGPIQGYDGSGDF